MTQSEKGPFFIRSKIWFEDDSGEVIFGLGRLIMLEAIERQGSMARRYGIGPAVSRGNPFQNHPNRRIIGLCEAINNGSNGSGNWDQKCS